MCPWKHIEILATWKCSKMAGICILKAVVKLTTFSVKLSAAGTEILYKVTFSSASKKIIWSLSFRFN
jgi:hypothetical protein